MQNVIRRWRATWNPDMYHGWGKTRRYFEGWYFKIVDPTEGYAFAFIPGISMGQNGQSHAFIQVLDGKRCTAHYHHFDASAFQPADTHFDLSLGKNRFSARGITLDLPNVKGTLSFHNPIAWPRMLGAPGIMGWYSFVPFMECYHGIVSMNHGLSGSLVIDNQEIAFDGGLGYVEKDWGISFPKGWIWLQTNHFFDPKAPHSASEPCSLIASVARIPMLGTHFIGYIVGFWWQGQLYRFATYTGAQMKAAIDGNDIALSFKDSRFQLDITATKAGTGSLVAPLQGEMTGKVNESLQAVIHVRFFEKGKLLFEGNGRNAGLEAAGAVEELLTDAWRR